MEKDTGTILRQQPLGEHGLIITWSRKELLEKTLVAAVETFDYF